MSWRRTVNTVLPLCLTVAGMLLVFSSIILFVDDEYAQIAAITAGFFVFLVGSWYRFNPLLTSERRYLALRAELDRFVQLVRTLHRAVRTGARADSLERMRAALHESVERMAGVADRAGPPDRSADVPAHVPAPQD